MKRYLSVLLAGTSLPFVTLSSAAYAQDTPAEQASTDEDDAEIVITARRKAESLQDVPQAVIPVTAQTVQDLNLFQFSDLNKVVSGLQIQGNGNVSMRGVTFSQNTAAPTPTVSFYLNDSPVTSAIIGQGIYDVGQFEFLRGPQGTYRGLSSPSGAITYTTRRPDMDDIQADASASAGTLDNYNFQAAIGIPIIPGVLAVRVAGLYDKNDAGGVHSVNSDEDPTENTKSGRITLRFEPTDYIDATVTYQKLKRNTRSFGGALWGSGSPGCNTAALAQVNCRQATVPAGFPQPFITPGYNTGGETLGQTDFLNVQERRGHAFENIDYLNAQVNITLAGQKLSYVGSRVTYERGGVGPTDGPNYLVGYDPLGEVPTVNKIRTHELRLASAERIAGIFDYVVGMMYVKNFIPGEELIPQAQIFLTGAFGPQPNLLVPIVINPFVPPNERYRTDVYIDFDRGFREISFFGNITAHPTDDLEIAGGIRRLKFKGHTEFQQSFGAPFSPLVAGQPGMFYAAPNFAPGLAGFTPPPALVNGGLAECNIAGQDTRPGGVNYGAGQFGATYPGICDVPALALLAPFGVPSRAFFDRKESAWLWDLSIGYKVTPALLLYGHAGTAFRAGPASVGIQAGDDPQILNLLTVPSEKSRSFEAGFKWTFMNGKGRLNANVYKQKFKNFFLQGPLTTAWYLADINNNGVRGDTPAEVVNASNFTVPVPVKVTGVEIDFGISPTDRWNVSGNFSWADGKIGAFTTPCQDSNFNGIRDGLPGEPAAGTRPTVAQFIAGAPGKSVVFCNAEGGNPSTAPKWNVNLQSEYNIPIMQNAELYLRGLVNYQPKNPNAQVGYVVPAYAIVDLYLGVRHVDRNWDVMVYGRNITNTQTITSIGQSDISSSLTPTFGPSGLRTIAFTQRREFGVTARYRFGGK